MTDDAIAVVITIGAPFDAVWHALRDPAEIRRWHGWEYDGLEEEIDVIYVRDTHADEAAGTIDLGGGHHFTLAAHGAETVVTVTMPAPTGDAGWEDFYDDIREGWASFVTQLRFALERHRGEERRTLQLDGAGSAPLDPAAIGLDGAAAGERYEGTTAWGEHWSGTVLFRNEHQVALTVEDYGPGLVILHAKPAQVRPPQGGGMAIVTTYGVDDAAFAALEQRWTAWWLENYD